MKLVFASLLSGYAYADMYLQFPGGSNNRLNEPNRDVRNDNRMFDSQNNNRFGHNQHGHYFYTGSEIDMQWTVQHSCGPDSNVKCDIILQYACEDNLRDGNTVNTIPKRDTDCENGDCNSDNEYGMHEDHQYYQHCSLRERNKNLFIADRHLRGSTARFTRQENNGDRYGYECNEERDYYPYWHPTIWKDIAVFTDDTDRCEMYENESENVKGRWHCHVSDEFLKENYNPDAREDKIPINKEKCEAIEGAEWKLSEPHKFPNGDSMEKPVCQPAPFQRDNHHGNGDNRYFVGYKWTVPEKLVHNKCSVRIRYNITSADYDAWNVDQESKIVNDRLSQTQSSKKGCFNLAEDKVGDSASNSINSAIISGRWVRDVVKSQGGLENALTIDPRPNKRDQRIRMTRESLDSNSWRITTKKIGGYQWVGWRERGFAGRNVKVTFDVKFAKKPVGGHYGMKFYGKLVNGWVDEAPLNEWHTVELNEVVARYGDGYHVIFIFDSVSVDLEVRDFKLCVVEEFTDKVNPFHSFQEDFGWDAFQSRQRGYEHRNDARLQIFEDVPMRLRSAYNTDQLGRVFEDRSHKIEFRKLPADVKAEMDNKGAKIYNINARGKIGNNVEVYPAFEYDFVPSRLEAQKGDYVHIQWSGSNTNDRGNDHSQVDKNGNTVSWLQSKDRHNMVAIDELGDVKPTEDLEKLSSLLGLSGADALRLAFDGVTGGDNEYLQSAGAYFDLGLRQLTEEGKFMFMSTVNNRFGVRSQKGKVIVN
jgi:hypothetical protein